MQNPLDRFRTKPTATSNIYQQPEPHAPSGLKPYKAFEARGKGEDGTPAGSTVMRTLAPEDSLEIRQVLTPWQAPEYRHLLNVIYNGEFATRIVVVFAFLSVDIEGEHLQHLDTAIRKKTCIFIQDFHPQEFLPPEPSQTIIHSIKVTLKQGYEEDIIKAMPKNR